MTIGWLSLPLGFGAGVLGVASPCVWPLVPVVLASARAGHRLLGPGILVAGLATSFALFGGALTALLLSVGLDPGWLRTASAFLLAVVAVALLVERFRLRAARAVSAITGRIPSVRGDRGGALAQFGVGALLGVVWLPCAGPTLGAAVGLASLGQELPLALGVMTAYGLGTGAGIMAASLGSRALMQRLRPSIAHSAAQSTRVLGAALLLLALLVLTGLDRVLAALALRLLPGWAVDI